jgi:hypothetical protein
VCIAAWVLPFPFDDLVAQVEGVFPDGMRAGVHVAVGVAVAGHAARDFPVGELAADVVQARLGGRSPLGHPVTIYRYAWPCIAMRVFPQVSSAIP